MRQAAPAAAAPLPERDPGRPTAASAAAAAVAAVAFAAYLVTLHRGVPGGDSGELIAAAATGGAAHPSGYPLFVVLGRLFAAIPIGDVATRVNALSAVADAAAAGLLTFAAARWSGSSAAGILAGGLFAFSSRVWSYATVAEVFALNNLVVAALVATAVSAPPRPSRRHVMLAAALAGLGLADHLTSIFISAPIVVWLTLSAAGGGGLGAPLASAAIGGAVGVLPYAYLPFASASKAAVSWGDETTVGGFLRQLLRSEYGTFQLASTHVGAPATAIDHIWAYLVDASAQLLWAGAVLVVVGIVWTVRRRATRAAALALLAGLTLYVVVFNALSNLPLGTPLLDEVQSRFWQMPNLILFAFAACGFAAVAGRASAPRAIPVFAAIVVVAAQALLHARAMDDSRNRWIEAYGRSILDGAPPRALILSRGDLETNSTRYLRYVDGVRPDVDIIDQEILSFPWGIARYRRQMLDVRFPGAIYSPGRPDGFTIRNFLDANVASRPIVVCGGFKTGDTSAGPDVYRLQPRGLCADVVRTGTPLDPDAWLSMTRPLLPDVASISRADLRRGSWEELARTDCWNAWHARAYFLMSCADCGIPEEQRLWRFLPLAEQITRLGPNPPWEAYKNTAYALTKLYLDHPELRDRLVCALLQYLRVAPADDAELPIIRKNLAQLGAAP